MLSRKDSIGELVLKVKYLVEYMVGIHSKIYIIKIINAY